MKRLVMICVALVILSAESALAVVVVEDFEAFSLGTNLIGGVGGWGTVNATNTQGYVTADPLNPTNQVGYFRRTGNPAAGGRYLDLGTNIIADGSAGEFSILFLVGGNGISPFSASSAFGLSCLSNPGPASGTGAGMELHVDFRVGAGTLQYMTDQGHSTGPLLASGLISNTWYELTATIDNANNTVSNIYLQGGTAYSTKTLVGAGPYSFNLWADGKYGQATDLKTFFVFEQGYVSGVYFDNIAVPEPVTFALLGLGGLALLRRKR